MLLPSVAGLVHRADEAELAPFGPPDHAGLAYKSRRGCRGQPGSPGRADQEASRHQERSRLSNDSASMEPSFQRSNMAAPRSCATFRSSGERSTLQAMRTSATESSHSGAISSW